MSGNAIYSRLCNLFEVNAILERFTENLGSEENTIGLIVCPVLLWWLQEQFALWLGFVNPQAYFKCTDTFLQEYKEITQIARIMGPTWGPPGSCQPQVGPM